MLYHDGSIFRRLIWLKESALGDDTETKMVDGVPPLTLSDAVARGIKSIVQYGKCEQASTPTPSSPVDIYCNNGKLGFVDDELPRGYKRLESINFDGSTHYETGEKLNGEDIVTLELSGTSQTGQNVFGCYSGTSSGIKNFSLYIYGAGSSSNSYFRFGEQLLRPRYGSGRRVISFGKGGTEGFTVDATAQDETFVTDAEAWIGMLPNSSSPAYTGNIWGSIFVGTRLRWIPCERQSDGVVCYYEKYKGTILEPVGGNPTAGNYDTSHETVLSVIGNSEVMTVSGTGHSQTASVENLFAVGEYADTQNIISGSVVRKCGIHIFNGYESISFITNKFYYQENLRLPGSQEIICSHFPYEHTATIDNSVTTASSNSRNIIFNYSAATSVDEFKGFLRAQYAAGTPVIVLYPLAEESIETVAAQPLSTVDGTNTVSVVAEVSGVRLTVEYKGTK